MKTTKENTEINEVEELKNEEQTTVETNEEKEVKNKKRIEEYAKHKKEQKVSKSYTLKAISKHIMTLLELNLITEEEAVTMVNIKNKARDRYMEQEF